MKALAILLLSAYAAMAAVNGTIVSGTSGQPQAGAQVMLFKFGTGAMEQMAEMQTDAQGKFAFAQELPAQGPAIVRVRWQGVLYNKMLPPGSPTTGLSITVFDASKQPGPATVEKHMILFEPSEGKLAVTESWIIKNPGKTTWFDPAAGSVKFYLPKAAGENPDFRATAPDGAGMSVPIGFAETPASGVHAARFEIKPGETRMDLSYQVPYTPGEPYEGKVPSKDENTYLIVPNGITLTAEGLTDLGTEPRTQAHIYGFSGAQYKVQLTGTVAAAPAPPAEGESDGSPQIEAILPRVNTQTVPILAIALGILALGFVLLYRKKETDERGSR